MKPHLASIILKVKMPCDKHFGICLLTLCPEGFVELFILHTLPLDVQIVFGSSQEWHFAAE